MMVEYMTGNGVVIQQIMNKAELMQLLQADDITLMSVNAERTVKRYRRTYHHKINQIMCLKGKCM